MAIHTIHRQQFIRSGIEELWQFFCNPANLGSITPAYMNFRITSPPYEGSLHQGQVITYKISPLLGISIPWTTVITVVNHHQYFTDVQRRGPYKLWEHTHTFSQQQGGILMTDDVRYELPLGILGTLAHTLFVKRQLERIFDYRRQQIDKLFNGL